MGCQASCKAHELSKQVLKTADIPPQPHMHTFYVGDSCVHTSSIELHFERMHKRTDPHVNTQLDAYLYLLAIS